MTYSEFTIWLEGYLEGCKTDLMDQQKVIAKKLKALRAPHDNQGVFLSGLKVQPSPNVIGINGNKWETQVFNASGMQKAIDADEE